MPHSCLHAHPGLYPRLHPVLTVQDRVQKQIMATGPGTLAKTWFDSLVKSIYTLSDEGKDQFLYAQWS